MTSATKEAQMFDEKNPTDPEKDGGAVSGDVLHGGEGDPLGGGVSELEDEPGTTEGEPKQD